SGGAFAMRWTRYCSSPFFMTIGLAAGSAAASDGAIRLQFNGNVCQTAMVTGDTRTLYVFAVLDGATLNGLTGVEYSMKLGDDGGPDPGWVFHETFAPGATISLGTGSFVPQDVHPWQPRQNRARGVNVAFSQCQSGSNGMVLIETVQITD